MHKIKPQTLHKPEIYSVFLAVAYESTELGREDVVVQHQQIAFVELK